MNSEKLQAHIQTLEQKLKELIERCKTQQEIIQQLQEEQAQWQQKANNGVETPGNFSNKPEIGTIIVNEEQARALGSSIERYIKDIDKSIAYLEQRQ
ncbi:MAG: hypothetical protein AAF963_00105 [Bacteroidota bacterium]